jgi:protein tyrosine phosphatase type IVA
MAGGGGIANKPAFIEHGRLRFLVIDCPTDGNLPAYLREFKAVNVTQLVRASESAYGTAPIVSAGIAVHDMVFPDGDPPPDDVITRWLALCRATFAKGNPDKATIAVHCVAGLGRTPVLVAIALIEEGLEPLDAVAAIRAKRRGAINARQLRYLEHTYRRRGGGAGAGGCCAVM